MSSSVTDQVADQIQGMLEDIRHKFASFKQEWDQQTPLWDLILGFVHAVDWRESWIIGLVAAEVLLLLLAVLTRRNLTVQGCIFALAMGVVYMGERLNALGREHWKLFSGQNYFDPQGVFFCVMVSGPLLAVMFIVLINYLLACMSLLVQAKRAQLKHKARQRQQAQQQAAGSTEAKKEK